MSNTAQNIPLLTHPIMKFGELRESLIKVMKNSVIGSNLNGHTVKWFGEGADVEVLKYGSQGWKKGKMRITISLEFCSNEPEAEEIAASNKGESSEPASPLDDIRRMQG
ncbi:hypothetical protein NG792_16960 [Laspinema sp. C3]|uniref:KGK family protein n=2 Tax=Laspinema TaxID=2584823 RepID=A0ABT2N9M9_9CYAN|nr:hypothetical protein [Laspinema sp. D3b]